MTVGVEPHAIEASKSTQKVSIGMTPSDLFMGGDLARQRGIVPPNLRWRDDPCLRLHNILDFGNTFYHLKRPQCFHCSTVSAFAGKARSNDDITKMVIRNFGWINRNLGLQKVIWKFGL